VSRRRWQVKKTKTETRKTTRTAVTRHLEVVERAPERAQPFVTVESRENGARVLTFRNPEAAANVGRALLSWAKKMGWPDAD
jgi:hypothetical protein